jgi:hypothetical protein
MAQSHRYQTHARLLAESLRLATVVIVLLTLEASLILLLGAQPVAEVERRRRLTAGAGNRA